MTDIHTALMNDSELPIWTIYWNPSDYPNRYVVRRCLIRVGNLRPRMDREPTAVTETLDEARRSVPKGLVCIERDPRDDRAILEVWL